MPDSSSPSTSRKQGAHQSASSPSPSSPSPQYFVVRHCDSLQAPAIFSAPEDCSFYIDASENDSNVEYRSFKTLYTAISYAFPEVVANVVVLEGETTKLRKEERESSLLHQKEQRWQQKLDRNVEMETERWKQKLETEKQRWQRETDREQRAHGKAIDKLKTTHEAALAREQKRSAKAVEKETTKLKEYKQKQTQKKRGWRQDIANASDDDDDDDDNNHNNNGPKRPRVEKTYNNKDNLQHVKWKRRFEELERYKEVHGDCNVPSNDHRDRIAELYPDIKALSQWVATQRTQYRFLKQGKPTWLTRDRIQLLEGLGFVWSLGPEVLKFEQRVDQLKEYLTENGHCNVPQKQGPLGEWVMHMRKLYREQRLSADRIAILEELGFQWSLRNRGGPLEQRMAKAAPLPPVTWP
jgi:hypothetical protein